MKRIYCFSILILMVFTALSSCSKKSQPSNVIFIVVDTLRADHLGCYGYSRNTSPNIDALSRHSLVFKNAVSQAPWTTASVASMFTSLYPFELGIKERPVVLQDSVYTLPELFKENGYRTKGIISHLLVSRKLGFHQGFEEYDEENSRGHMHISSPSITDKAISFLEKHGKEKFFLFLHYFDPHYNYVMHEAYDYYPGYDGPLYSRMRIKELRARIPSLNSDDVEYIKAAYDSEIRFTDEHIGRLFDKLREWNLYEDTMIIFTADHGEEFLEKTNRIGHSTQVFQETIHVPLIIKLPKQDNKRTIQSYTGLINLMPTIADYLGIPLKCSYKISGESLNLRKKNIARTTVFSETYVESHSRAVFQKGWKLIEFPEEKKLNLYHLISDPGESSNVANAGKDNQNMTRHLLNLIRKWEQEMLVNARHRETIQPKFTEEEIERLKALGYIK